MKQLLILAIAVLALTACTKENQIQGEWEAYYYSNMGVETHPSFVFEFTKHDFVFRSTIDEQQNTGTYHIDSGILYLDFNIAVSEWNITLQGDEMTLTNTYEVVKLRRL